MREERRVEAKEWAVKETRRGAGGEVGVGGMSRRRVERRKAVLRRRGREGSRGTRRRKDGKKVSYRARRKLFKTGGRVRSSFQAREDQLRNETRRIGSPLSPPLITSQPHPPYRSSIATACSLCFSVPLSA